MVLLAQRPIPREDGPLDPEPLPPVPEPPQIIPVPGRTGGRYMGPWAYGRSRSSRAAEPGPDGPVSLNLRLEPLHDPPGTRELVAILDL